MVLTIPGAIREMSEMDGTIFDIIFHFMASKNEGSPKVFEVHQETPYLFEFCVHRTQNSK